MSGEHPDRVTPHDPIVHVNDDDFIYLTSDRPSESQGRAELLAKILEEHARMITALEAITAMEPDLVGSYAQSILDGCDP